MKRADVLIAGVGGQGIILASEIMGLAAMKEGLDVKKAEVHGMSQPAGVWSPPCVMLRKSILR